MPRQGHFGCYFSLSSGCSGCCQPLLKWHSWVGTGLLLEKRERKFGQQILCIFWTQDVVNQKVVPKRRLRYLKGSDPTLHSKISANSTLKKLSTRINSLFSRLIFIPNIASNLSKSRYDRSFGPCELHKKSVCH